MIKLFEYLIDALVYGCLAVVLYAAFNSQACLKVWDYQYGVCPDFYKQK